MRPVTGAVRWLALGAATVVAALALAGCDDTLRGPAPMGGGGYGYPPPPPPPPPMVEPGFSAQEFAWSQGSGPGQLSGKVAYRSVAGERWTCGAQTVALIPATRYSGQRMRELYGSDGQSVVPAAEVRSRNAQRPGVDYGRYVRTAVCDARDGFSFTGLPPGPYFLIARARPHGHAGVAGEGVVIMQRVDIAPGPTRIVVPRS